MPDYRGDNASEVVLETRVSPPGPIPGVGLFLGVQGGYGVRGGFLRATQ